MAVHQHAASLRHVQSLDEFGQRALAGTRAADDADHLARLDVEIHPRYHFGAIRPVPERRALKADRASHRWRHHATARSLGWRIQDVAESLDRDAHLLEVLPELRQANDSCSDLPGDHVEG